MEFFRHYSDEVNMSKIKALIELEEKLEQKHQERFLHQDLSQFVETCMTICKVTYKQASKEDLMKTIHQGFLYRI